MDLTVGGRRRLLDIAVVLVVLDALRIGLGIRVGRRKGLLGDVLGGRGLDGGARRLGVVLALGLPALGLLGLLLLA